MTLIIYCFRIYWDTRWHPAIFLVSLVKNFSSSDFGKKLTICHRIVLISGSLVKNSYRHLKPTNFCGTKIISPEQLPSKVILFKASMSFILRNCTHQSLCPALAWKKPAPFINSFTEFQNATFSWEEIFHPETLEI